jgi:hypothetical protein
MTSIDTHLLSELFDSLDDTVRARVEEAADRIVRTKERGGNVVVVTGSGPNIHEGVTTLLAELMRVGVLDGVSTSSAVIAHEMGGTLDKVKRCNGAALGLDPAILPRGHDFELTLMRPDFAAEISRCMEVDSDLIEKLERAEGKTIIKAAGNLGYPAGLWMERLSNEIQLWARERGMSFEEVAGLGADTRTMIGMGARRGLPVLVTIPQLVGGGSTGLAIGDSISIAERASRLARMLESASVVIESAVALTQEIHDGPYELYTGHGLWSAWDGGQHYSLEDKSLIRIDLDPALETVYQAERGGGGVQDAIAQGLPKTKTFNVPFRMEMSGFARHEGSLPIIGDIGVVWPLLAQRVAERLNLDLEFMSYPQQTEAGRAMREWIVDEIKPVSRERILAGLENLHG